MTPYMMIGLSVSCLSISIQYLRRKDNHRRCEMHSRASLRANNDGWRTLHLVRSNTHLTIQGESAYIGDVAIFELFDIFSFERVVVKYRQISSRVRLIKYHSLACFKVKHRYVPCNPSKGEGRRYLHERINNHNLACLKWKTGGSNICQEMCTKRVWASGRPSELSQKKTLTSLSSSSSPSRTNPHPPR